MPPTTRPCPAFLWRQRKPTHLCTPRLTWHLWPAASAGRAWLRGHPGMAQKLPTWALRPRADGAPASFPPPALTTGREKPCPWGGWGPRESWKMPPYFGSLPQGPRHQARPLARPADASPTQRQARQGGRAALRLPCAQQRSWRHFHMFSQPVLRATSSLAHPVSLCTRETYRDSPAREVETLGLSQSRGRGEAQST